MNRNRHFGAAVAAALAVGVVGAGAFAQEKHESNTLKKTGQKIGHATSKAYKATEYGVRKGGEAVNVTAHKATGKNSVVRDRGKKQDYLVKPDGTKKPVPPGYNKGPK